MTTCESLVLRYWRSWQGESDWAEMRACLADELDTEHGPFPADQLVTMASSGNPWMDVELVDAVYTADQAALYYRGTDTASGDVVNVAEFLTVAGGKIVKLRGILPPMPDS